MNSLLKCIIERGIYMRRYMKRSLCIIVTFIMVVLNNFVTPASDINFQKDMIKFRAYLINVNTGEKYMVKQ